MMMTIKEAKANARILQSFMAEQGTTLPYGVYLEAVARLARHKNWATYLVEANAVEALVKTIDDVTDWPTFVLFFDECEENGYREALYVLPLGVTLDDQDRCERHGPFDTRGALEVPEGFKLSDKTVAMRVYSVAPSVDKYGLPHYADEDKAAEFFREDLRCAAISAMDVSFTDSGDDSSSRFWFEARVHPDLAAALGSHRALSAPEAVQVPSASAPLTERERIEVAYSSAFADVFESVAGRSVDTVVECLTRGAKTEGVPAAAWLRMTLKSAVVVEKAYEALNCRQLMAELRTRATLVYDDLLLRELGH